jgi:group I intron endonuclease
MIGIYKITSPSGKVYVGQAVDLERREKEYVGLHCKSQRKLYNSLVKYGFSQHIFRVIEECTIEQLNVRERHWQDFYNVLEEGLNLRLTGTEDVSGKQSKETIAKRVVKTRKPVLQYTTDGVLVREWKSGREAGISSKISGGDIVNCCKGKLKSAGGFIWKYKTGEVKEEILVDSVNNEKPILQYSKEGILIKEWKSITQAGNSLGIYKGGITMCCKNLYKSLGGSIWRYKTDNVQYTIAVGKIDRESSSEKSKKPIAQYSKELVLLKKWESAKDAGEFLGISSSNITQCCRGAYKTSGGFSWKYIKE